MIGAWFCWLLQPTDHEQEQEGLRESSWPHPAQWQSLKTQSLCFWSAAELDSSSSPHSELSVLESLGLLKMAELQLDFVKTGKIALGR